MSNSKLLSNTAGHKLLSESATSSRLSVRTLSWISGGIILLVLVIDQLIKFKVKTGMLLYQAYDVTSWFKILFTENQGMAFGMDFIGTMLLTLFRVVAICFFVGLLAKAIRRRLPAGLIICLSMVIAGAAGNIIDNCFYGLIFTASPLEGTPGATPAVLTAFGEGNGSFLTGHVVDMFYFPLFTWPDWVPLLGGKVFFNAIFNFADASISCGAVAILIFYWRFLTGKPRAAVSNASDDK